MTWRVVVVLAVVGTGVTFASAPGDPDCNDNGIPDATDIALGTSTDCNDNGVPDECDITAGTSADCNGNGFPDECDLMFGVSMDCDANDVPDECDIAQGAPDLNQNGVPDGCEPDCNGNGVPDFLDLAFEVSLDCNVNDVPDECDIESGLEEDCNGNVVPDACEVVSIFEFVSDPLGPIGTGSPQSFVARVPSTVADVDLHVDALADLDQGNEFFALFIDGTVIDTLFVSTGQNCVEQTATASVAMATYNALASDGMIEVLLLPSGSVSPTECGGASFVSVRIVYQQPTAIDVNANGIPDDCECLADADGSGDVGFADVLVVIAAWGPCERCVEDIDFDGDVGFSDLLVVIAGWGRCP